MAALLFGLLTGCAHTSTRNLPPVTGFDAARYAGTWYEVARITHRFERGLEHVTATYTAQADGSVGVLNRGYDPVKGKWRSASARAVFAGARDEGLLRVSFFRPFWGTYKVIRLDAKAYGWAVVTSGTTDYFWILSRTPSLPEATLAELLAFAKASGFDPARIERVAQGSPPPE